MYLGNSDGRQPFIAGLIEHNLVRDTIGYNVQIKHQLPWPGDKVDLPQGRTATIIRHNVFGKGRNSSTGRMARPNLLVGDVPSTGPGSEKPLRDLRQPVPSESFRGAVPGRGQPRALCERVREPCGSGNRHPAAQRCRARRAGLRQHDRRRPTPASSIERGSAANVQRVDANVVFADPPIVAPKPVRERRRRLRGRGAPPRRPARAPGKLDLSPRPGMVRGPMIDVGEWRSFTDWDRDFDGRPRNWTLRGAYARERGRLGLVAATRAQAHARKDRLAGTGSSSQTAL